MKKPEADPLIARNHKAAHDDYHLGESWEAGIVLEGLSRSGRSRSLARS
ncbi:hypothetical protein E0H73_40210 [Kribbella pittospori]|uniref:Uncharacterized protein n=1 Tax=Kribbella pittospori TaxID=722689 RepID=A0A4R0JYG7_9ACTN|nr:hypothetical protein [Kribbella pittospori]TCC52159.1 hypothetical protein E0H73_40210 [Kribbella pittospori]